MDSTVHKRNNADIWNVFQNAFAAQLALQIRRLPPQIRRLLPRIRRFLPKTWQASSEERWVCTHISFWNRVQLCLQIFRIYICVFQAAFVMERFLQMHVIFKDAYHTCLSLKKKVFFVQSWRERFDVCALTFLWQHSLQTCNQSPYQLGISSPSIIKCKDAR